MQGHLDDKMRELAREVDEVVVYNKKYGTDPNYKHKWAWARVLVHVALQLGWLIGIYTAFVHAKFATVLWSAFIALLGLEGVALGAHRGYTHKSFRPSLPLKVALIAFQTLAGQNSMFTWARDHKLHHKYSDTDADPHNANRGFFFAHMGWLMMEKHPLVKQKQREIDVSELLEDKLLMFQYKYFLYLYFPLAVVLPISVPYYFWNETLWSSIFVAYFLQYVSTLHITWTINSFAHYDVVKPYDKRIRAAESPVATFFTLGDGWHNFHHAFPWDYRMADKFSLSAKILHVLALLGLAYDLKIASVSVIQGHMRRHGDGSGEKLFAEKLVKFPGEQSSDEKTKIA